VRADVVGTGAGRHEREDVSEVAGAIAALVSEVGGVPRAAEVPEVLPDSVIGVGHAYDVDNVPDLVGDDLA